MSALLLVLLATALAPAALADNSYSDSTGDVFEALDIVSASVKHDSTDDVTFEIRWAGGERIAPGQALFLWIDSDKNGRTGDDGFEIVTILTDDGWDYYRWDGTRLRRNPPSDLRVTFRRSDSVAKLDLPFHAINESRSFRFYLQSVKVAADAVVEEDLAPDAGLWAYRVDMKPWVLQTSVVWGRPAIPLSGKKFTATLETWRAEDGETVTTGTVQCVAQVGTKPIAARGAFVRGMPGCTMAIPANSGGKQVRGTIGVSAHGGRVTKKFAFTVL